MNDSSILASFDFSFCDTQALSKSDIATEQSLISNVQASAVSSGYVAVSGQVAAGYSGAIEAKWPDGRWAGIGYVDANNEFYNPAVPVHYLFDAQHINVRLQSVPSSAVVAPVIPIIFTLSNSPGSNGAVYITGTSSLSAGGVEAFSNGTWKGIGPIENGAFVNPSVPASYQVAPGVMRVRVLAHGISSEPVDATQDFPQPRSILFTPTLSAATEAAQKSWRIQKADYQPTGYFAPMGIDVEVWASGNVEDVTLLVGIQGMADRDNPAQQSANMRAVRLVRGRNVIRDPLGGVIHIRHLRGASAAQVRLILGPSAVPIPYYIKGVTTAGQWQKMLTIAMTPEVEMVGDGVVIAAFRATANLQAQIPPEQVVGSHEKVLRIEAQVCGLDGSTSLHSRTTLLIYAVESASSKSPHATTGYIGLPYGGGVGVVAEALIGGKAANRWVTLHEYGHHHQNRTNSFEPLGEVSVNLYSLAVGRVEPNEYTEVFPQRWPATEQWLALPRGSKDFSSSADPQAMYEQLRKGLGESFLPTWDKYIREHPCTAAAMTCFVLSASVVAGFNLTDFFADWGLLKESDTDTWQAVAQLGLPPSPAGLTHIRPYV